MSSTVSWRAIVLLSLSMWLAVTPAWGQRPPFAELEGRADKALSSGDVETAILLYEKLANFYPDSAQAHNKLGVAHYQKGNDPRAIFSFRRALSLSRQHQQALHNLILASGRQADTLAREARFAEAARLLDDLLANYSWHPQYSVILYYRGRLEFLRGQPDDGLNWWKKAAAQAPDSGVAKVVAAQSRPFEDRTLALYREAAERVKTEPGFDYLLGVRYTEARRHAEAVTAFERGLETCRRANIPFPLLSLRAAQAHLADGHTPAAIGILEEARRQRPDWASLCTLLWACYLAVDRTDLADQTLQDAFQLDGKPKLALLGASPSAVRLNTTGGSLALFPVSAASPSEGPASLTLSDQTVPLEFRAGSVVIARVQEGRLTLESQAQLTPNQSAQEGSLAPPLVLKDRRGQFYRLADALLKRPVVVLFWSASDAGSTAHLQGLGGLEAHYRERLETVAIHTAPSLQKEALKIYLSQPSSYAHLWGEAKTGEAFGVTSFPALVVIDGAGRIVRRETELSPAVFQDLLQSLDTLP